ncbi:hypothetical protein B0H66DRAFT_550599 [Apodospora peruviana]|uniref:Eisosome protein 1 n=1 Tax=Apodospora peruviana TaxID=516989 RepID=A0AAE0IJI5_9PEZI|nr:hypothetical protein B0H66DRAFT_550599 [Apodospora peruviana]
MMMPLAEKQRGAQSSAGSQAAILAAGSARRRQQNQSSPPSLWGSSAANLAFKANISTSAQPSSNMGTQSLARQGSLRAAKGAMAGVRPRSMSSPQPPRQSYPDQANAASNALSAATVAHRPSMRTMEIPIEEAGAIPFTNMNRQMFTSHPLVKLETDERNRNDVLHASAVAMAKRMYTQQQKMIENTKQAHSPRGRASSFSRHGEASPTSLSEDEPRPMVFGNLQEAAYRLAQERLAKLQDEHQQNRGLQEYYGSPPLQRNSKLGSIRNKLTRRRSSSDGDAIEDQKRSHEIRKRMSMFSNKLEEVDEQKRARDREALLAAAQRNVKARLQTMDDKIRDENGGIQPANKMGDWEWKAHAAAQARFDASQNHNYGKIDIGGGKFIYREEVDQIAAKKVQPLLDEINKNAEKEYERRALQKAEEEKQREEMERNKQREREIQQIHKKLKDQQKDEDKARKAEIKQLEKHHREEAKAAKAEQKRLAKDGKQQKDNKEVVMPVLGPVINPEEEKGKTTTEESSPETKKIEEAEHEHEGHGHSLIGRSRALSINFSKRQKHKESKGKEKETAAPAKSTTTPAATSAAAGPSAVSGDAPPLPPAAEETELPPPASSPTRKVKTWLKTRFQYRPRARSSPGVIAGGTTGEGIDDDSKDGGGAGFIGGAALAARLSGSSGDEKNKRDSMREVAMAGRETAGGDEPGENSHSSAAAAAAAGVADAAARARPLSADNVSLPGEEDDEEEEELDGKFGNEWSTGAAAVAVRGSEVSSLSSSSSSSLDRFEEARSELERPEEPPGVGGGTTSDGADDEEEPSSILERGRPISASMAARPNSPYRESRFAENFDDGV